MSIASESRLFVKNHSAWVLAAAMMAGMGPVLAARFFGVEHDSFGGGLWWSLVLGSLMWTLASFSGKKSGGDRRSTSQRLRLLAVNCATAIGMVSIAALPFLWIWTFDALEMNDTSYGPGWGALIVQSFLIGLLFWKCARPLVEHKLEEGQFSSQSAVVATLISLTAFWSELSSDGHLCRMACYSNPALHFSTREGLEHFPSMLLADAAASATLYLALVIGVRARRTAHPKGALLSRPLAFLPLLGLALFFTSRVVVDAVGVKAAMLVLGGESTGLNGLNSLDAQGLLNILSSVADAADIASIAVLVLSGLLSGAAASIHRPWASSATSSWRRIWPLFPALFLMLSPMLEPSSPQPCGARRWQNLQEVSEAERARRLHDRRGRAQGSLGATISAGGELEFFQLSPSMMGEESAFSSTELEHVSLVVDGDTTFGQLRRAVEALRFFGYLSLFWSDAALDGANASAQERWRFLSRPALDPIAYRIPITPESILSCQHAPPRSPRSSRSHASWLQACMRKRPGHTHQPTGALVPRVPDETPLSQWLAESGPVDEHWVFNVPERAADALREKLSQVELAALDADSIAESEAAVQALPRQSLWGLLLGLLLAAGTIGAYVARQLALLPSGSSALGSRPPSSELPALLPPRPPWVRAGRATLYKLKDSSSGDPYRSLGTPLFRYASQDRAKADLRQAYTLLWLKFRLAAFRWLLLAGLAASTGALFMFLWLS